MTSSVLRPTGGAITSIAQAMGSFLHTLSQRLSILAAFAFRQSGRIIQSVAVRQVLPIFLIGIFSCRIACAYTHERTITRYVHRAWSKQDGAPGNIRALAQTSDGFLWIGADDGLYRFDGVNFEHYEPFSGPALPTAAGAVDGLLALPDGDLWIGYSDGGVSLLRHGRVMNYDSPRQVLGTQVCCFAQDDAGRIWAGGSGGLARFEAGRWTEVKKNWNFPGGSVSSLFVDHKGTLWVGTTNALFFLPRGARTFRALPIQFGTIGQIREAPNGKLWMAETSRSVRPVPLGTRALPSDNTEVQVGSEAILFADGGDLWITTLGDGLRWVHSPESLRGKSGEFSSSLEGFTEKDGLTDNVVLCILQDREGNIWVGTRSGLDRFRKRVFTTIVPPDGDNNTILVPADDGDIWLLSRTELARVHDFTLKRVILPRQMAAYSGHWGLFEDAYRDPTGAVWWVTTKELLRSRGENFTRLQLPKGLADSDQGRIRSVEISKAPDGTLWMDVGHEGLFYFKAGTWCRFNTPSQITALKPTAAYTDDSGRIWFGYKGGALIYLQNGKIQIVASAQNWPIGHISAIRGHNQQLWVAGTAGLSFFDGTRLLPVYPCDVATFGNVSGMEETADGGLWLRTPRGIIRITRDELHRFLESPTYRVHYQLFDSLDGMPGRFESTAWQREVQDSRGRLWFAASLGMAELNPASISGSYPPPPAVITRVIADGKRFPLQDNPILPALTRRLEIDFAGLNLYAPQRVRCRYELEGIDKGWQYAGKSRQTFYTNLAPGNYRFRLSARNVGGDWNAQDTVLLFHIAPAWFQTIWFRVLSAIIVFLVAWTLYRLRVRQVAHAMSVRFDDRLVERTRIARDFHDTLLQTIQGSKLVADSSLKQSADPARMQAAMEQLSLWLGRATEEGRTALNSLRTSTTETNDLVEAFRRSIEECRIESVMEVSLSVAGEVSEMHPIVRDEVYRIGYEAIRNACAHSQASRIQVELKYGEDLILRVRDNGIGIDPATMSEGKEGHFGLQGMRERAGHIMSKLTIDTSTPSGTEVKLVVPGAIIYRRIVIGSRKMRAIKAILKWMGLNVDSFHS